MTTKRGIDWTARETATLRKMKLARIDDKSICERLGRSRNAINNRWQKMLREQEELAGQEPVTGIDQR
jgi:hypothetical protein